jgi:predicted O-methyltransferase YrrM
MWSSSGDNRRMSIKGTDSYAGATALPDIVAAALALAYEMGFASVCRLEQGRLLSALASGARAAIGETGTGCGVGLAWMVAGRQPGVRVLSVERNEARAERTAGLFAEVPDVEVIHGDWTEINHRGPFDLLVLDGGGNGKTGPAADPERLLTPAGTLVVDDFTPLTGWPPMHAGRPDDARLAWLEHRALLATEVRVAPDLSTIIATRRP